MQIRDAQIRDKKKVLEFCKNTFSWGDYIEDVWDSWMVQGNLFVALQDEIVIGLCHLVSSNRQAWLEGIRIRPEYKRKGFGRQLISHCESITRSPIVRMIIESENLPSISLAHSMGYRVEEKWQLYCLAPKKEDSKAVIASDINQISGLEYGTYPQSWRWLPLEKQDLERLLGLKRIVLSIQDQGIAATGIWNESENFANVLQLVLVDGSQEGLLDILRFIQNKGYELQSDRIQVFAQEKISLEMDLLSKRSLFYLMRKDLFTKNL